MEPSKKTENAPENDLLLDENDLHRMTKISPRTWQLWRRTGAGPEFVSISSKMVRYRLADVNAWIEARLRKSTSEEPRLPVGASAK